MTTPPALTNTEIFTSETATFDASWQVEREVNRRREIGIPKDKLSEEIIEQIEKAYEEDAIERLERFVEVVKTIRETPLEDEEETPIDKLHDTLYAISDVLVYSDPESSRLLAENVTYIYDVLEETDEEFEIFPGKFSGNFDPDICENLFSIALECQVAEELENTDDTYLANLKSKYLPGFIITVSNSETGSTLKVKKDPNAVNSIL